MQINISQVMNDILPHEMPYTDFGTGIEINLILSILFSIVFSFPFYILEAKMIVLGLIIVILGILLLIMGIWGYAKENLFPKPKKDLDIGDIEKIAKALEQFAKLNVNVQLMVLGIICLAIGLPLIG